MPSCCHMILWNDMGFRYCCTWGIESTIEIRALVLEMVDYMATTGAVEKTKSLYYLEREHPYSSHVASCHVL